MNAVTITTRDRTKTATCREVLSMCGQYDVTVEPSWTGNGFLVLHDRVALPRVWPKCPDTCWAAPLMEDGSVLTYAKLVNGKSERHPDTGAVTEAGMLDLRERRLVRKMTKLVRLGGVGQIPYSVYAENGLGGMNMVGTGYMQILVAEPYSSPDGKDLDLFRPEVDPAIINELSGRISDNAEAIQVNAEAIDGVAADLEEAASEMGSAIESEEGERKAKDNELDGKIESEASTRSAQIAELGSSKADKSSVYTKAQVQEMLAAQRNGRFIKVTELPSVAEGEEKCIYLVPREEPEQGNVYDEYYVAIDENTGEKWWDKLGSTDIDLSGYAKKEEVQGVRDSVNSLASDVDALQDDITSDSSRISTLENKVDNPSSVPTEDSNDLISSGGVFAALADKADKETDERFMRTKADIYLSARKGNDANDGLAPERAVKTIGRAYAAAKAAVDAQTLDGTKQVVVAVDEGVYGSVKLNCELTAGIAFRAVGARESTFVVPSDTGDVANQTPMSCDNGVYPRVFEMEGFTFTGFNGRHHSEINLASHQRGIVYGMTLRRCLITGNRPICTKAFVCGTFIDCEITGNATMPTSEGVGGDAPFGGYGAVYDDLAYMTRMFNCHVWDNDFSTFQYFASKIEASGCLFENSFAVAKGVADSYGGHNNTMIAERYTNPYFTYSDTRSKFYKIGVNYFAVIASSDGCTTDPFYAETDTYVCVQTANLTDDKVAADASCPSVRSDGSLDFGYRDSGFGRKKTADSKQSALMAQQLANIAAVSDALAFDATHTYEAGDPVVYDGTLYTFTASHTGAWTGSDVSAVDIIARLADKLDKSGGTMTGGLTMDGGNPITFSDSSGTRTLTIGLNSDVFEAKLYSHGNLVYTWRTPFTSGVFALASELSSKLDSTSAAPAFSSDSSTQYPVGSHCTYQGKLYKCTTATTGGTWVAGSWTADTMTDPDATLDITAQNQLRVVAKDGTLLWAQGYDLASTSSATLACDAVNNFTFADGATTQAFTLPTAPTGKAGDFGLDIDNSANTGAAMMTLTGLDTAFSIVVPKGESLNDMLSIAAGELARFYITLSTFRINNLPTWHIVKQVVENGGATV